MEKRERGKRQGAASEKRRLLDAPLPPTKSTRAELTTTPARDRSMLCARRARALGLGVMAAGLLAVAGIMGRKKGRKEL